MMGIYVLAGRLFEGVLYFISCDTRCSVRYRYSNSETLMITLLRVRYEINSCEVFLRNFIYLLPLNIFKIQLIATLKPSNLPSPRVYRDGTHIVGRPS